MPPSQLAIATSSITRLLKDEDSYRTELASQQKRLERLEAGGGDRGDAGNVEFQLRQEKQAIDETKAVFGPLKEKITNAVEKVEGMLNSGGEYDAQEIKDGKDAVAKAREG